MKRFFILILLIVFSCSDAEKIEFDCNCRVATYEVETKIVRVSPEVLDAFCDEENKWFNKIYDNNGKLLYYSYLVCDPK